MAHVQIHDGGETESGYVSQQTALELVALGFAERHPMQYTLQKR